MSVSYKQTNIVPGGGGKSSGKSTIIHCHYKSYEVGLMDELAVVVPINFVKVCSSKEKLFLFVFLSVRSTKL